MSCRDDVYAWLDEHHAEVDHLGYKPQAERFIDTMQPTGRGSSLRSIRRHVANWWEEHEDNRDYDNADSGRVSDWDGDPEEVKRRLKDAADSGSTPDNGEPNWRFWNGDRADHVFTSDDEHHDAPEEMDNPESSDKCLMFNEARKYVFILSKYPNVTVTFDEMSDIIRCYVYEGSGMTQKQVCRYVASERFRKKHGRVLAIRHGQFKRMLWAIRIDKNSLPFAPHEYREKKVDELTSKWRAQAEAAVEDSYRAKEAKHWKKKFRDEVRERVKAQQLIEEITGAIPAISFSVHVKPARNEDDSLEPYSPINLITDWHVGACVEAGKNSYNKAIGERRIENLKREMDEYYRSNTRPVEAMYWGICGDIVEGQEMRADHGRKLDLWREEQTDQASRLLSDVLAYGHSLFPDVPHFAKAVGGNHGRGSSERDDDPARIMDMATYQIARAYTKQLDIDWEITSEVVNEFRIYSTQVLQTHGERCPREFDTLIRAMLDKTAKHHLLMAGHYHSEYAEGNMDSLAVQGGSIIGDTPYGLHQIAVRSRPSQRIIEVRRDGPRVPGQLLVA